ncbi:MAG: preprotein translocase subunit SecG [Caldisericota bacterium]|nr:preprotein translocase subunit SecG [Caldisericota bacterium]
MRTVLEIVMAVVAVGVIVAILLMSPKGSGLGAISGSATMFSARKSRDVLLDRLAVVLSIVFMSLSLVLVVFKF